MKTILRTNAFDDHFRFSASGGGLPLCYWATIFGDKKCWSVSGHIDRARSECHGGLSESRNNSFSLHL